MDSMELLFDSFSDALIDSVKLIPFLLVTYLLMEWLEQRTEEKQKQYMQSAGAFGPLAGGALGIVPQCGFSCVAANLYSGGVITAVLVPVLVLTSGRYRPSIKRIWQIFLFLFTVVPSVYVINRIWGCNFMFLCYPSNGSPFLSVYLQHGYVPYLIIYAVTVILCILVIYGILDKIASFCGKNVVYINRKN